MKNVCARGHEVGALGFNFPALLLTCCVTWDQLPQFIILEPEANDFVLAYKLYSFVNLNETR